MSHSINKRTRTHAYRLRLVFIPMNAVSISLVMTLANGGLGAMIKGIITYVALIGAGFAIAIGLARKLGDFLQDLMYAMSDNEPLVFAFSMMGSLLIGNSTSIVEFFMSQFNTTGADLASLFPGVNNQLLGLLTVENVMAIPKWLFTLSLIYTGVKILYMGMNQMAQGGIRLNLFGRDIGGSVISMVLMLIAAGVLFANISTLNMPPTPTLLGQLFGIS